MLSDADSGKTWSEAAIPLHEASKNPLRAFHSSKIRFSSPLTVWLIADNLMLFRSDDSGRTWKEIEL
jgi:photosystem II stability/assembly factor-like uncharacterized protein